LVFAPAEDGYVYALEAGLPGEIVWRFPAEGEGVGSFVTAPLYHEGILYAATQEGTLFAIEGATGEEVCQRPLGTEITAPPVLNRSLIYVGTAGSISMVRTGSCGLADQRLFGQFLPMNAAPLVDGNSVYLADGSSIIKLDLQTNLFDWRFPTDAPISSSPALAGDTLYFGANDGKVYAVDARTGEERWSFQTGGEVRSSPAVADGAIYVGSRDGFVYAIAGTAEED
jgi:outer membrane protein assembly factor BamB